MANILNDYKCQEHGYFESYTALCPKGCTTDVFIVHLQAPGMMSDKTKKNDKTVKQLAMDFKMTNIKSTREGEAQTGYLTRSNQPAVETPPEQREPQPRDSAIWGGMGNKGLNMGSLLSGKAVKPIYDEQVGFNPKSNANLTGPRAASYMADQDNLSISKK
jgi:hypothetical protein